MIDLPLNIHHQLALMLDILNEQAAYKSGTVSEYEQISRLIQSMMSDPALTDNELKSILPALYDYCKQGAVSTSSEEHITAHKSYLNEWMQTIENSIHQMK